MNSFRFQIALFLFLLGLSSISYAQKGMLQTGSSQCSYLFKPSNAAELNDSIRNHFAIKINPLQWLWDDIRLMVEVPISKTNSLQFRVGYRNSKINPYDKCCHSTEQVYWNDISMTYDTGRFACQGINWGVGMTHYIENKMYLNFSFLYKFYSYKFATLAGWTNPITDLVWTSDNELIHRDDYTKRVAGFEVRIGKIIELNRFGFDVFLGFGSRFRKRVVGDDNEKGSAFESDPSGFIDKNTTISINCGLNIFFNLNKIS